MVYWFHKFEFSEDLMNIIIYFSVGSYNKKAREGKGKKGVIAITQKSVIINLERANITNKKSLGFPKLFCLRLRSLLGFYIEHE